MRRIVLVAFPDFQTLDVAGPVDVFGLAERNLRRRAKVDRDEGYVVELAALRPGPICSSTGLTCIARRSLTAAGGPIDTLLVVGGPGARLAAADKKLIDAVKRLALRARRVGSVCTGAFVLAAAGLLEGRRATTHWATADALAAEYPAVKVDPDAIYVRDGSVYTSAGVTAGIDLSLALVEEDHGRDLALDVARTLVVFAKRPGGQTQFSAVLSAQFASEDGIRAAQRWMLGHPEADLSIEVCAKKAGMSPRNFARVFAREVHATPAAWVETMRVERARALLVESERGLEEIAVRCGFGSTETMRRAFLRRVHVPPSEYRRRFQMGRGRVSAALPSRAQEARPCGHGPAR